MGDLVFVIFEHDDWVDGMRNPIHAFRKKELAINMMGKLEQEYNDKLRKECAKGTAIFIEPENRTYRKYFIEEIPLS